MPRDASGNYTLPLGNPVVGGTVIDVNWANPTMADVAAQLNNVYTRDGLLGPLAPFKLVDGVVTAPGLAFNSEGGLGLFRVSNGILGVAVAGAEVARFTATGMDVPGVISKGGIPVGVPPGTILDFGGPAAPSGYLVCNGQAVSRTTYAALFAAIGSAWGAGDGSTTFNVPDMRRRAAIGSGGTAVSGPGNVVGNVGGSETQTLAVTDLPVHAHPITDAQHAHLSAISGNTGSNSVDHQHYVSVSGGDHEHIYQMKSTVGGSAAGGDPQNLGITAYTTTGGGAHSHAAWSGGISANHTHAFSGSWASDSRFTGINTTNNVGSGAAHNNMQPSATVNKIIKT